MPNRFSIPIQAIVHDADFDLSKVKFDLKTEFGNGKPIQALWSSTYQDDFSKIGWIEWKLSEQMPLHRHCLYRVVPKASVRIYEINVEDDFTSSRLPKLDGPCALVRFLGLNKEREFLEGLIDYKRLAKRGYDGLHFTRNGAYLAHESNCERNTMRALHAIDCESTVWFNTSWIESIELVASDLRPLLGVEE